MQIELVRIVEKPCEATGLYLMRHTEPLGHRERRIYGHADVGLAAEGIGRLHRLGETLRQEQIAALYCSDLERSFRGGQILARYLDLPGATRIPELRERRFGAFECLALDEIRERFPREYEELVGDWIAYTPPGAESLRELARRVMLALEEILQRHEGRNVAVMGHGGVNRIILLEAVGLGFERFFSFEQAYGCLNVIDYDRKGAAVKLLNSR